MSGFGAPFFTATMVVERATGVRLAAFSLPVCTISSKPALVRTAASVASPSDRRFSSCAVGP